MGHGVSIWGLTDAGASAPNNALIPYFNSIGMKIYRIPVQWEYLQHSPNAALDPSYLAAVDGIVNTILNSGSDVILDVHNFMRYQSGVSVTNPWPGVWTMAGGTTEIVGESKIVSAAALSNLWLRLAAHYPSSRISYELMNEPNTEDDPTIVATLNSVILALRAAGHGNKIMATVGDAGDLCNWGCANLTNFTRLVDPANNLVADYHIYFDAFSAGQSVDCVPGSWKRPYELLKWAVPAGVRVFVGEFGGANNPGCRAEVTGALEIFRDSQTFIGWTWWVAGANPSSGPYMFQLAPVSLTPPITPQPQQLWLQPFLH